jgi:hypothetical protein
VVSVVRVLASIWVVVVRVLLMTALAMCTSVYSYSYYSYQSDWCDQNARWEGSKRPTEAKWQSRAALLRHRRTALCRGPLSRARDRRRHDGDYAAALKMFRRVPKARTRRVGDERFFVCEGHLEHDRRISAPSVAVAHVLEGGTDG